MILRSKHELPELSPRRKRGRADNCSDYVKQDVELKRVRLCNIRNNRTTNTVDVFANGDMSFVVFSFLGVKELYKFAMLNKIHRERLKHEHVIRSAIMSGGCAKTSIERLIRLIKEKNMDTITSSDASFSLGKVL